ncbi:ABC transporter substrate-binding protein [Demequina aurantiaca]|uniref:ABC transporter substrate-binding protein n=1 Tax=Demequina aurantiaca TaxID=676200 RepID=UPI000786328A|nr:extracellular solute-binding protein [Demequina aurantiaca]
MKKTLLIGATIAASATVLASCSSDSPGEASKGEPLTVLTYAQNATDDQLTMYQEFFDGCTADGGYAFKQLQVPADQLLNKAVQLTASGDAPDVIVADNQMIAGLAKSEVLTPIELGSLDPDDFVQGPFKSGQYEGEQYGLPVGNNGEVIVYNKQLLDDAGLSAPESWADLSHAAQVLTTDGRYGFGQTFAAGETLSWNYWAQLWSAGGSIAELDSSAAVESAEFWASFLVDGTAPQASLQWQSDNLINELVEGRLAMAQVGTWTLNALLDTADEAGIEIGITTQVSKDGEAPIVPFGGEVMVAGVGATGEALTAVNDCIISWSSDTEGLAERDEFLGYLPSYIPAQAAVLESAPHLEVLAEQLKNSRGRTEEVGANYQSRTVALSAALQQIATGAESPEDAMAAAQSSAASGDK